MMTFSTRLFLVLLSLTPFAFSQTENPREFWAARSTKLGKILGAQFLPAQIKNPQEIEDYLACHLTTAQSRQDFKAYQTNYTSFTKWSSQTFDLPRSLSTCLMFRESTFKEISESDKGALGIHQMMPKTYDEIRNLMADIQKSKQEHKVYQDLMDQKVDVYNISPETNKAQYGDNEFIRCQQFAKQKGLYYDQAGKAEKVKSTGDCQDFFLKYEYRSKLMSNYGMYIVHSRDQLLKSGNMSEYNKYFPNSPKGQPISEKDMFPPAAIQEGIKNPMMVVGMQMFYLKEMILRMDNRVTLADVEGGDPVGYLMLLAGGYNAGTNALLDSMESGKSVQDWCNNVVKKGGEETKNYMLSVRRCLSKFDYSSPTGQDSNCDKNIMPKMTDPCVTSRPPRRPDNLGQPAPTSELPSSLRPRARPENLIEK